MGSLVGARGEVGLLGDSERFSGERLIRVGNDWKN